MYVNDFCTEITQQIIEEIKAGTPPWTKPWTTGSGGPNAFFPYNVTTGAQYHGSNIILLWMSQYRQGFSSSAWAGFKQMKAIGGTLRRKPGYEPPASSPYATGQRGTPIARISPVFEEKNGQKELVGRRLFTAIVFNLDQFEGYDENKLHLVSEIVPDIPDDDRYHAAQVFSDKQGVKIHHGTDEAAYYPAFDYITMPTTFSDYDHYYCTLFHEQVHATMHPKRLERDTTNYALEELVAELGSAFLCAHKSIVGDFRHAGYIEHYVKALNDDHRLIFKAARMAQEAMDYMLVKAGEKIPDLPEHDAVAA